MSKHTRQTRPRPDALLRGAARESRQGARQAPPRPRIAARRSSASRSSSPRSTSARSRITNTSRSPRRFPGRAPKRSAKLAKERGVVIIASLFEKRERGPLPQHRGDHRRRRHVSRQVPEDAHPGRPALLREVLLHARRPRLPRVADALREDRRLRLLGSMVSRSRAAHRARRRADSFLSRPPSAGIPARKRSTARGSTTRGKRSSARTPSRMAATSPCRIASATKRRTAATASSSGDRASSPILPGRSWPRPPRAEEEILIVEVDLDALDTQRTHWPFFRDRRIDAYGDIQKRFID